MSEKRFRLGYVPFDKIYFFDMTQQIKDKYGVNYFFGDLEEWKMKDTIMSMSNEQVLSTLNEQQDTIEALILDKNKQEEKLDIARRNMTKQLEKINEQQATIDKVYELLKEEADIFSDEATEHDINAYIELQKFDNKDAYYLACSIKQAIKLLKGDE